MNAGQRGLPEIAIGAAAVVALVSGLRPLARPEPGPAGPPQFLPVEAEWCLEAPAAGCIGLEVPRTPRQYALGLMQRPPLGPLRGMWFRFDPPQRVSFWMHRTLHPLDLLFLSQGRVVAITTAPPCPRLPCPSYWPEQPADGVVELDAGEAARLGITEGSPAPVRRRPGPSAPARD